MSKRFYVTTAIDYVNGEPHLGHAYEKVVADVMVRAHRSLGEETFYLTGLDEHGQKVEQAARQAGVEVREYCDRLAGVWRGFVERLGLCNDDFVRTSDSRHRAAVVELLRHLHQEGHFYKDSYTGYYSTKQETFLTDRDRLPDGSFDPLYGEVSELKEENWYFRLGRHQQWLSDHIRGNPGFVHPENRRNEVLGFLENNELEDLCISRPRERLQWGIPLPFDPGYVTYVWFDALVNYASIPAHLGDPRLAVLREAPGKDGPSLWPADVHVIGKDILKFHAVYWPIMLKAAGLELPRQICVHGWWQKDGEKMSKSTGNIVDPLQVIGQWGLDAFRYYLVRELDIGGDGNWTDEGFASRYSAELANGLGNLVHRSLSMLGRYRDGIVPARAGGKGTLEGEAVRASKEIADLYRSRRLQAALQAACGLVAEANRYIDRTAPFKLARQPDQAGRLDEILYSMAEAVRILAVLLWPVLPSTSGKIYRQLALQGQPDRMSGAAWGGLQEGHKAGRPEVLFPRPEQLAQS